MRSRIAVSLVVTLGILAFGVTAVAAGGRPFETTLTGAAEVPGPGDPDGFGTARITLNQGQGEVCWQMTLANVDPLPFAAHIHVGTADVAGPVVVTLYDPASAPTSYPASACVTGVDRDLIKNIRQNPDQYYVNAHNAPFPGGAVRGQLSK